MKENLIRYVRSLSIGGVLLEQISNLYDQCQSLVADAIEEIIVSEIIDKEGIKSYDLLYFFSNKYIIEIENFVSQPEIWIINRINPSYVKFTSTDFNMVEAQASSRLAVTAMWGSSMGGFGMNPKAAGQNCLHVLAVMKRYVISAF